LKADEELMAHTLGVSDRPGHSQWGPEIPLTRIF